MSYRTQTISTNQAWRVGSRGNDNCWPGTLAKDNAAVNGSGTVTTYGKVIAGTVLAEDSSGNLHPAGCAELDAIVSGAVALTIPDLCAPNFYIGDEVAVLATATERTIAITGEADTEVIRSATPHGLRVGDHVAVSGLTGGAGLTAGEYVVASLATAPPILSVVGEADDETFTTLIAHGLRVGDTVYLSIGAGGAGAVSGAFTVATAPSTTTFTLTAVTFTTDITVGTIGLVDRSLTDFTLQTEAGVAVTFTTDITVGTLTIELPEPTVTNITGTRNIVTVNHSTGAITVDGAVFSAAIGDLLVKIGAYKPAGFLNDTVSTRRYVDDTEVTEDRAVNLAIEGDVRNGYATGCGAKLRQILKGGAYADPMDEDTIITPKFVGFTFRDV